MKYPAQFDLYTDFLVSSPNIVSSCLLSDVLNHAYSHDSITRMLAQPVLDQKKYWQLIKSSVRAFEKSDGLIAIDDTISEKPYSETNQLICWHYDHTKGFSVKGINIVTFTYVNPHFEQPIKAPVAFETVIKDTFQTKTIKKDGKFITKTSPSASISKNKLIQDRLHTLVYQNHLQFKYIAFDTWFSGAENINFIVNDLKKAVVCAIKDNRTITFDTEKSKKEQQWIQVSQADIEPNRAYKVRLKNINFDVLLLKKVYHNLDGSVGVQYLISTDTELNAQQIADRYKERWASEDSHRSLKQNTALEKMPAKTQNAQSNHIFASMIAQMKLECIKIVTKKNHYQLKRTMIIKALQAAWQQIAIFKEQCLTNNVILPNFTTA